jgi:hypothetical protein
LFSKDEKEYNSTIITTTKEKLYFRRFFVVVVVTEKKSFDDIILIHMHKTKKGRKKRDENQENCIHLTEKRRMMPEESYKFSLTFHHNFSFFLRLTPPTQQLSLSLSRSGYNK